ncbi:basic leucine zipper transcription factor domain-containing protein [Beauveria brongniartii RCEF 3172]|uniref:Basic leucine zipper transcription factor domain-containing protein n=1 Tax=Beauveria brongniartii RCEF 3172 TaxID=1081107 RepID=A0A162JJT0_9HYPO|nr:basic leucine zipper transcription factor domain-containing protein [Beauveria brongniartii RCEF 3172]
MFARPPPPAAGEKARENREIKERHMRNLEHAGNSYRIPSAADITGDGALSGLPWGSVNLGHVVSRGHEAESKRSSSGRNTYNGDASSNQSSNNNNNSSNNHDYTLSSYGQVAAQPISYGAANAAAAAAEGQVVEDSPYFYGIGPPLMPAFFTQ